VKIWKDKYKDWAARKYDGMRYDHRPLNYVSNPPENVLFVRVCSFTFAFFSAEEIQSYLDYYSKKTHPSSATPNMDGSHWEFQTKFDELPLYLREEPKRKQVVKALTRAMAEFSK
jgi:hypothetical protein